MYSPAIIPASEKAPELLVIPVYTILASSTFTAVTTALECVSSPSRCTVPLIDIRLTVSVIRGISVTLEELT